MLRLVPPLWILAAASCTVAAPHELWLGSRADGQPGGGTLADPLDASTCDKLNALFDHFRQDLGDGLTLHFGPGVFWGDRLQSPLNNWKIRGAGMDVTIFRTTPNPNGTGTFGFRAGGYTGGPSGFEISDVTFDFNTPNLRHANRAFISTNWGRPHVFHLFVDNPGAWEAEHVYRLGDAVAYQDGEYVAQQEHRGRTPSDGAPWCRLWPNQPAALPAWDAAHAYVMGDAVSQGGAGWLCRVANTGADPSASPEQWGKVDPEAPDPAIYTHAVFIHARPPGGRHRIPRCKAVNGNGSAFFGREALIFGLGGDDCVIEDCLVEDFRGDYGSLIVMTFGQHGVVRGCTVRGNDGVCTMAYGGWACWDTVFEGNFCTHCRAASNIDSLLCRNVTFRGNTFLDCREVGILVNLSGNEIENHRQYSTIYNGEQIGIAPTKMDGLFIVDNLVEMRDGAPYGAIQGQTDGPENVLIARNVLRTLKGTGKARAVGTLGKCRNVTVMGNVCEPGMSWELSAGTVASGNRDLAGGEVPGR
ncbi:MAG: right-handed parallel beta-helix repeat-containing protein [Armatimonadetes bacterium]|nr:right-handed parallel beta-helix repeat-containing protein [Armatimonadota bacterium]